MALSGIAIRGQIMNPIITGEQLTRPTANLVGDWDPDGCTNAQPISTITDSIGSHNLTAATTARPTCVANGANGHSIARFDGVGNIMASSSFSQAQPVTAFLVVTRIPRQTARGGMLLNAGANFRIEEHPDISAPVNGGAVRLLALYGGSAYAATNAGGGLYGSSAYSAPNGLDAVIVSSFRPALIEATWNGASSTLQVNRNPVQTGSPGSSGISGGVVVGAFSAASFQTPMDFVRLIIANGSLSAANKTAIENYLIARYGIRAQNAVTIDGDSLSAGYGLANIGLSWPALFFAANPSYAGEMASITGQTCATISTNFAAWHSLDKSPLAAKNMYWLWCGTNDFFTNGTTAAALETIVQGIASAAHSAGLKIGFVDVIARKDFTAGNETNRQAFNVWARANWATYFDAFVDLGADANVGCLTTPANCYNNATYFQADGFHLNATGNSYVQGIIGPAILAVP